MPEMQRVIIIQYFQKCIFFFQDSDLDGFIYGLDIDIIEEMYGGTLLKKRNLPAQGIKALKATGGNFAFELSAQKVRVKTLC